LLLTIAVFDLFSSSTFGKCVPFLSTF
jgi:hypothetical protein